jgi:hypothetical protein
VNRIGHLRMTDAGQKPNHVKTDAVRSSPHPTSGSGNGVPGMAPARYSPLGVFSARCR